MALIHHCCHSAADKALKWAILLVVCALGLLTQSSATQAHEIRPAIIDLYYAASDKPEINSKLSVEIVLNLESLIAGIGPEHDNTDTADNADFYKRLRTLEKAPLLEEFARFQNSFLTSIKITTAQNVILPLSVTSIDIPSVGDIAVPRDSTIILTAKLPNGLAAYRWQWSEMFGEAIVRANSNSTPLDFAVLLSPGQRSELIHFTQETTRSTWAVLKNYIVVGFEHILPKGLDHILFVVGLFLLTYKWRALAAQITTFTLAHSITLALGASGLLRISASIVEPLIALSIVFVCVENFLTNKLNKWRIVMVFLFGLLHGLGFASVLDEVGLDNSNFLIALVGFNLGVELGQLLVVVVCLITIAFWFANKPYYRRLITQPASMVIGLVGLYWFAQRIVV